MTKKILGLLLVLCMVCAFLPAVSVAASDSVTIAWWYRGNGEQTDTELVNAKINEMLKEYEGLENVTLELHCISATDYKTQVTLGLASGEQMDILNTVNLNMYELALNGTLRPIDAYMDLVPELIEELPAQMINYGKVDGVQYIICHQQQVANGWNLNIPTEYIDNGWMDGDKLSDMLTLATVGKYPYQEIWQYMEDCLLAVREGTGSENIYLSPLSTEGTSYSSIYLGYYDVISGYGTANGFIVDNATHTVQYLDTIAAAPDIYAQNAKWYDEGLLYFDSTVELIKTSATDYLTTASPKMVFETSNGTGSTEYLTERNTKSAGFPITSYQLSEYFAPLSYSAGGDGITTSCANPEAAIKVIECMNTKRGTEIYNTVVYGIEGIHWAFNEDGETITTFGYDGTQGGSDYLYSAHKWIMGNTKNAYLNQGCTPYTRSIIDEINQGGTTIYSQLTGIAFDTEDISSEVEQIAAIYAEYHLALVKGVKGQAEWQAYYDEYVGKVEKAGVQTVIDHLQAQVDAYLGK